MIMLGGTGHVGIFWLVREPDGRTVLLTDMTPLDRAEAYGEHLTHPTGHLEFWERLRRLPSSTFAARGWPTAIAVDEYEDHPRGRIVFHVPSGRFTLYADKRLHRRDVITELTTAFGISEGLCEVRSDPHYRRSL
jgi:hypothetical protein